MQSANCVCTSTGRIAKRQRRLRVLSVSAILHPCRRAVDSLPSAWLPPACRADHPLLPQGPAVHSYRQKVVAHLRERVRNLTQSRIAESAQPSRMTNETICPLPQQSPSAASLPQPLPAHKPVAYQSRCRLRSPARQNAARKRRPFHSSSPRPFRLPACSAICDSENLFRAVQISTVDKQYLFRRRSRLHSNAQ